MKVLMIRSKRSKPKMYFFVGVRWIRMVTQIEEKKKLCYKNEINC